MLRQLVFGLLLVSLVGFANAPARISDKHAKNPAAVEKEITEAIQQRLAALRRGDAKGYKTFFADECFVTGDNGVVVGPGVIAKEWNTLKQAGVAYQGSDPMDVRVHVYGDVAVANYRLELDEDWGGRKLLGATRLTDVFVHRGRWMLIAHQETAIPNARRVPAAVNPASFDAYAGEYQFLPNYVVKVKREGDKLMDQWPGDASFSENVPVDESTLVVRGEPGEVIYVKGANGKVDHMIWRTVSGDLTAKKTK